MQDYSFKSFRVTEKASIYLSEATAPLSSACSHIDYLKLDDFNMSFGSELATETLYIYGLAPTAKTCDLSSVSWTKVSGGQDFVQAATNNNIMQFEYSFSWKVKVLQVITLYGTGKLKISTLGLGYRQDIVSGGPSSSMLIAMTASLVDFNCDSKKCDYANKLKPALTKEISTKFPIEFENMAMAKIPPFLDQSAWNIYKKYEFAYQKGMLVDMVNKIMHTNYVVDSTNTPYVTLSFDSLISIPNRPFNTTIFKYINTPNQPQGPFDTEVCYNSELIPDILDILGKGRYFYLVANPQQVQLTLNVKTFASIMPEMLNHYPEETPINIGCRPEINEMAEDVNVVQNVSARVMQWPFRCVFVVDTTGEEILSSVVEFRMGYSPKVTTDYKLSMQIQFAYVHNMKPQSRFNVNSLSMISEVMNRFSQSFVNFDALTPGYVQVQLNNMGSYTPQKVYQNGDAYCITYTKTSAANE